MDHGGSDDGRCEFAFLTRCEEAAVRKVTFGQQNAWTYDYCEKHAAAVEVWSPTGLG